MKMTLLNRDRTGLVIIDMQERLLQAMANRDRVIDRTVKLIHLARVFELPVILTEQNPKGLGQTVPGVREFLPQYEPVEKMHFNCCEVDAFDLRLRKAGLQNLIVMGVETHICVFQTCVSLLDKGYQVQVPHQAVDSRTREDRDIGLSLMREAGAVITSTETIIFQLLKMAGTPEFKEMLSFIK